MRPKALYVETVIRTDLDTLWQHTQDPALHQRWDLRFAEISPVDGHDGHFRYESRFLGVTVVGVGVSVASRDWPDGGRTSSRPTSATSTPSPGSRRRRTTSSAGWTRS